MKLSILVPAIDPSVWVKLYDLVSKSCTKYPFEMIFTGPAIPNKDIELYKNIKFVRDFGCVSRAVQIASYLAEGELVTYTTEDAEPRVDAYDEMIAFYDNLNDDKAIINVRYTESENFSMRGSDFYPEYWHAVHHDALRQPGVSENWWLATYFMMNTKYYRQLGGIDCGYEHINMNSHDLVFRAQRFGSTVLNSPKTVMDVNYIPRPGTVPILAAFHENDLPRFKEAYSDAYKVTLMPFNIDLENWRNADTFWRRKWN